MALYVTVVTNSHLIGFKLRSAQYESIHVRYCNSQLPVAGEDIDLREKSATDPSQNQYTPQLHSKYLSLCSQISVAFTPV